MEISHNIFFCLPQKKKNHTGEGEKIIFFFSKNCFPIVLLHQVKTIDASKLSISLLLSLSLACVDPLFFSSNPPAPSQALLRGPEASSSALRLMEYPSALPLDQTSQCGPLEGRRTQASIFFKCQVTAGVPRLAKREIKLS